MQSKEMYDTTNSKLFWDFKDLQNCSIDQIV